MKQEILTEIYNLLKDVNSLPKIARSSECKPFNPKDLENKLISKFGKPDVEEALIYLYSKQILGHDVNDTEYYIKGYVKNAYFIHWDKFQSLLQSD